MTFPAVVQKLTQKDSKYKKRPQQHERSPFMCRNLLNMLLYIIGSMKTANYHLKLQTTNYKLQTTNYKPFS